MTANKTPEELDKLLYDFAGLVHSTMIMHGHAIAPLISDHDRDYFKTRLMRGEQDPLLVCLCAELGGVRDEMQDATQQMADQNVQAPIPTAGLTFDEEKG